MKDVLISLFLICIVIIITIVVQKLTKVRKRNHKIGVLIIPVTDETANVIRTVKSAFYEETFDDSFLGREILIVDFGCKPQVWEHYQVLAKDYPTVHAINSYELIAYLKVKHI
ncbi:MAG: hypothetical protein GX896_07230 [Clostridiales bacterium]|nr:hypothetical protein [Clostridiales bacterium]